MTDIRDRTDIEYREAPPAVDFGSLTTAVGTAPPVVQVTASGLFCSSGPQVGTSRLLVCGRP